VYGVVGIWGLLAVCITNEEANLKAQLLGLGTVFLFVFVASALTWLGSLTVLRYNIQSPRGASSAPFFDRFNSVQPADFLH